MTASQLAAKALAQLSDAEWLRVKSAEDRRRADQCIIRDLSNRRMELRPKHDGTTKVLRTTEVDFPTGTRIEISFGPALPADSQTLRWAELACRFARGKVYAGRSSPWWYDAAQFHELLYASGERPVRDLIASLDGCTGATAGMIVAKAKLNRTVCNKVRRE